MYVLYVCMYVCLYTSIDDSIDLQVLLCENLIADGI